MAKIFNNDNSGKFVLPSPPNSPELSLLKIYLPFLGCHLGFHIFFGLLGAADFFYSWAVLVCACQKDIFSATILVSGANHTSEKTENWAIVATE